MFLYIYKYTYIGIDEIKYVGVYRYVCKYIYEYLWE